ncbi:hypothetical protein BT93_D0877 [Corymbia citriodora subsp. variegata]|nr:hypothetical protein BT93_D0877 [Corymbia citriodora subsp. variegata]
MAPRISCSVVSILVLFLAVQPSTINSRSLRSTKPSLTSFQSLEGALKGQTKQGIKEVKRYLKAFGYFNYEDDENDAALMDDKFDEALERAIKSYQKFYRLQVTGKLDVDTVKQMSATRCGVPDVVHHRHAKRNAGKHSKFHIVVRYTFFPGDPKWPTSQTNLKYTFGPIIGKAPPSDVKEACRKAFQSWSSVSQFKFEEVQSEDSANIVIGFYQGDHGDGYPFDGVGNILAHASSPTSGLLHFDADEPWSASPSASDVDLESVALHEIGHVLGLGHSTDQNAVMFAVLTNGAVKRDLRQDDINGIHALYPRK